MAFHSCGHQAYGDAEDDAAQLDNNRELQAGLDAIAAALGWHAYSLTGVGAGGGGGAGAVGAVGSGSSEGASGRTSGSGSGSDEAAAQQQQQQREWACVMYTLQRPHGLGAAGATSGSNPGAGPGSSSGGARGQAGPQMHAAALAGSRSPKEADPLLVYMDPPIVPIGPPAAGATAAAAATGAAVAVGARGSCGGSTARAPAGPADVAGAAGPGGGCGRVHVHLYPMHAGASRHAAASRDVGDVGGSHGTRPGKEVAPAAGRAATGKGSSVHGATRVRVIVRAFGRTLDEAAACVCEGGDSVR